MKGLIRIFITFCLVLSSGLFGCKKMLEEVNPSGTTAEAVYTTPVGFQTLVNAAYWTNRMWYGKEEGMAVSEFGTDLWTAGSESFLATSSVAGHNRPIILYENLNPVNDNLTRLWRRLYAAVNLCNEGIKITEDGILSTSDAAIRQGAAELRFLRAWYYFHIVETWGGVHFTTEPTKTEVLTANRTPESVFYDQIITDLSIAITDLDPTSAQPGRVNQWVAKAFLARVYLTRGYKSFGSSSDFTSARDLAVEVINNGPYALLPNYVDLWKMDNQKNSEVIWSVTYSTDLNYSDVYNEITCPICYGDDILTTGGNPTNNRGNNNNHLFFIPGYDRYFTAFDNAQMLLRDVRNGRPFIRAKPTRFLLDLYDETMDSRYYGSFQTVWKVNYANTVGRLVGKTPYVDTALVIDKNPTPDPDYYTYDVYTTYNPDGSSVSFTSNELFPALLKHQDSMRSASPNDVGNGDIQSSRDVVAIRLAEMYLIAAEAELQLTNTGAAAGHINTLRTRAALPGQTAAMQVTAGDMTLDFILDERAREMAGEMIRWFDLKRTGQLISRVQAHNPDVGQFIMAYHTLRPIPQVQMDAVINKGEFTQNPGY